MRILLKKMFCIQSCDPWCFIWMYTMWYFIRICDIELSLYPWGQAYCIRLNVSQNFGWIMSPFSHILETACMTKGLSLWDQTFHTASDYLMVIGSFKLSISSVNFCNLYGECICFLGLLYQRITNHKVPCSLGRGQEQVASNNRD